MLKSTDVVKEVTYLIIDCSGLKALRKFTVVTEYARSLPTKLFVSGILGRVAII